MSRPRTISGLILRLAELNRSSLGCAILFVLAIVVFAMCARCGTREVRIATFNIENYPRNEQQVRGAFAAMRELHAPVIAVQEITDPPAFAATARERLGESYRFVTNDGGPLQRVGVLYDSDRFALSWARTHPETQVTPQGKPTLEVRLRNRDGGALRVFVVHLKAGGGFSDIRREQLRQLRPIVEDAIESWDGVVLLGDFNATDDEDRQTIAAFARATHLSWASEELRCTSYWNRRDGCRGVALDHVLTREPVSSIDARGPCEEIGCDPGDRCPAFHRDVSDHCPVTVDL
jgi:endonuclease/exonuclease/phosphatase family metal-dependent hydrolase